MFERTLVALGLIALLALGIWAGRLWYGHRNARIEERVREHQGSSTDAAPSGPRVVYFNTTSCVVCKSQQEPALDALSAHMPDLVVEQYDAVECPQMAGQYGVLSVPTVAVYDRTGTLVTINRGFTPASILCAQIDGTEQVFAEGASVIAEPVADAVT